MSSEKVKILTINTFRRPINPLRLSQYYKTGNALCKVLYYAPQFKHINSFRGVIFEWDRFLFPYVTIQTTICSDSLDQYFFSVIGRDHFLNVMGFPK